MNSHFLSAVAPYIKQEALTHQQQVCRLYKHALKALMSWSTDRDIFIEEATKLRKQLADNAKLDTNSPYGPLLVIVMRREAKAALEAGLKEYARRAHPDPYVRRILFCGKEANLVESWYPGGATYMRNAPPPLNVACRSELD